MAVIKALDGEELDVFSADLDPQAPTLDLVARDRRLPIHERGEDSELLNALGEATTAGTADG